jgi:DNA (cytosine-5)-methyltransferase 1
MDILKLSGISICTGAGGLDLALERWVKPVAYCEIDPYAQGVILSRIRDGRLPDAPIWDDLTTLKGDMFPRVEILYGGPPCQDFSLIGDGAGLGGARGRLMLETLRLIGECRPRFVLLENVPGIVRRGLEQIILELDALRYDARWTIVSAEEVGAPFFGKRLFILAKARGERYGNPGEQERSSWSEGKTDLGCNCKNLGNVAEAIGFGRGERWSESNTGRGANNGEHSCQLEARAELTRKATMVSSDRNRLERRTLTKKAWKVLAENRYSGPGEWPSWLPEPALPRGADGLGFRSHAIRCSGNGVVPLQAEEAFKRLLGID